MGSGVRFPQRQSGEIGRHIGLKIRRFRKRGVPVRFRSRAPRAVELAPQSALI